MGGKTVVRDPEDRERAWRMSRGGMTRADIAKVLGYPETVVNNWISLGNRFNREAMDKLNSGRTA